MWATKFYTYTKQQAKLVLYILVYIFGQQGGRRKILYQMIASIPYFHLHLISSWIEFWFIKVPKYLNSSAFSKELLPIFIFWLCSAFSSRDMTMCSGTPCTEIIWDMQKIQIIGLFFENRLHWQFEVWLLLYTVCTCILTFWPHLIWSYRSHNTVVYLIW